ncbi:MAG: tetratricopeptide repeat protein [Anaerolineae bacterium]|nr:tetratricopeptide repeat protein [Anaerolineae bacterium]MCI0611055.1 tetratricopeptide repeat protein [Anaerolineae bacterium]
MTNHPSGTVTFLFTDIEGSTQLWEQHPDAMKLAYERHEKILRQAVASYGGYAYKMIGDAFQVAFETAPEALAAALDAQRALQAEPWPETAHLRVRMALHTGVTEERGDDYVGPALNRVARLLGTGYGGQVLLTQPVYDLVRDDLPHDAELRDLGEHRLKDLIRPERVYQFIAPDLPSDFPPLKSLDNFPHNLPLQVTSFIGREKEMTEVKRLLWDSRLVTLTGPGGTGKSRLSLQIAADFLELYPDGAWLVELAPLADPALLPQTVANVLGIRESSGHPIMSLLTDHLRTKELLLILDNCEHLVEACAQLVDTLLKACPHILILASSREVLGIAGEATFRVPSLSTPDARRLPSFETLTQYEAVRLFIERAEMALPGFTVTKDNAPAIAQICYRLDGIPLAIELAAARVQVLRIEQIAARLDNRFRLLTGGSRTALPRHQTLRSLIDWSYDLLPQPERALLGRLSVFAGGWSLEAAEAICIGDGIEPDEVLDLLIQLVNKSLVNSDHAQSAEARYRLLETIRQYARDKLLEAGGGERIRDQHLEFFLKLAERAEPELRGPNQVTLLDMLENELDNLRAALEWALECNIEKGLRLASSLMWLWHLRGHASEGIEWLERALNVQAKEGDADPLPRTRAKALQMNGLLTVFQSNPGGALPLLEESLKLYKELGPAGRQGMAYSLWGLGTVATYQGNTAKAKALSEESLALFRELGDKFGTTEALNTLGDIALTEGDYEQARKLWEESLAIKRERGDKDGIAFSLAQLGNIAFLEGDYKRATPFYEEASILFREVGNQSFASAAFYSLGETAWAQGDYEHAAKKYEVALKLGQGADEGRAAAFVLYDLGAMARSQGNYDQAVKMLEEAVVLFKELGNKWGLATAYYGIGEVAWARGEYDEATARFEAALALSNEMNAKFNIALALYGLGKVAQSRGEYESAHTFHRDALTIRRGTWDRPGIARSLESFAALAVAEGQMERAAQLFGAMEAAHEMIRFLMAPIERDEREQGMAAARTAQGDEAFMNAYHEGKKMTLDEAVGFALGES